MTNYSSNVSDSGWKIISKYLKTERNRKYDLREVWNALMYMVKTGCQWRMLPHDFPRWEVVYYYFRKWIKEELNDLILEKLRSTVRVKKGQNARASLAIMDSQSVRWGNNRSFKSYDGNKKVKGIKGHVVVDKNGFLLAIMVTVAHIHDSKAVLLLMRLLRECFHSIKVIIADGNNLVVNTQVGSNNVQINTWYLNNLKEEKMRSGYLIHKNKKPQLNPPLKATDQVGWATS